MSDTSKLLMQLSSLPPEEAVKYMQGRGLLTATFDWRDLWQEEHALQFTVSRLARLDLVQAIYDGVTASVKGDLGRRDFMRGIQDILVSKGWWGEKSVVDPKTGETVITKFDANRLKLIYDVNTRQAYSAGLWQRIERNKATSPYIRYITKRDERVRASHRGWDNLTLPVDHPFWNTHTPLNGWRCRCRIMSMSQAEYDKGLSPTGQALVKDAPPDEFVEWKNKRTGEVMRVPKGIDPGFAYNPGKAGARQAGLEKIKADKLAQVAAPIRAAAEADFAAAPVPKFVPQKTAKDAGKWAVENNLADVADYSGIKPEVANEWNRSLFDHLQEFPALRANQKFVGTCQAQMALSREKEKANYVARLKAANPHLPPDFDFERAADRYVKPIKITNRYAHSLASTSVKGVSVNKKYGGDVTAFMAALERDAAVKYHPIGCNTIRSVVDHELGHQLDSLLNLDVDKDIVEAYREAKASGIKDEVSEYAGKNIKEFIAECWAEALNNPSPRTFARTVAEIVRARYKSRFGSP